MTALDLALDCARRGLPVVPCKLADKAPYTTHGFKDASTDPVRIRRSRPYADVCCWSPFLVQIPVDERDPGIWMEKLKAEWPAILRWALDGCLEWQRSGLGATQDRHRRHRGLLRRSGPHQAVARRLHRGWRPVRLHTE